MIGFILIGAEQVAGVLVRRCYGSTSISLGYFDWCFLAPFLLMVCVGDSPEITQSLWRSGRLSSFVFSSIFGVLITCIGRQSGRMGALVTSWRTALTIYKVCIERLDTSLCSMRNLYQVSQTSKKESIWNPMNIKYLSHFLRRILFYNYMWVDRVVPMLNLIIIYTLELLLARCVWINSIMSDTFSNPYSITHHLSRCVDNITSSDLALMHQVVHLL